MGRTSFIVGFLSALAINTFAQEAEKRPMTVDDGLNMVRVEDALISPDGDWVLFGKSELDSKKNKRKSIYYRIAATGGDAYQYVSEAGGSDFQFSPKGTYLSFLRAAEVEGGEDKSDNAAEKDNQLFLMRTEGGEAVQLTKIWVINPETRDYRMISGGFDGNIRNYFWTPDGTGLVFTGLVRTDSNLFKLDVASGKVSRLTQDKPTQ